MTTAVGAADIAPAVLGVLGSIKAGTFTDARSFIEKNRGTLTVEQRQQWVEALWDLVVELPRYDQQLNTLIVAVYECEKVPGPQ
ncbi:hypothetical protein [Micromonospora sp. NPDC049102]|uniref:hypothetical protein n=1 Tax=Micromonospora sp. NPDC049102 TaxID=3364265 RepID=UPI003722B3A1